MKYPEKEELFDLVEKALYFHSFTMDGIDFFEYGGFGSPEDITEEGLLNFFKANADAEKYYDAGTKSYRVTKKQLMDFYSGYFADTAFLEEKLGGIYEFDSFAVSREANVIYHTNATLDIEENTAVLSAPNKYEAVFTFSEEGIFYESLSGPHYVPMSFDEKMAVCDYGTENLTGETVVLSNLSYGDWRFEKTSDNRLMTIYRTDDFSEPFGYIWVYKDDGETFDKLLARDSLWVFEEDIFEVKYIASNAEKASYVHFSYPSKPEPSTRYLRLYQIQYEGYVVSVHIYINYENQQQEEGECAEFIGNLSLHPLAEG